MPYAGDHTPHAFAVAIQVDSAATFPSQRGPDAEQRVEEDAERFGVVGVAVISRKPTASARGQQRPIGPAVFVDGVDQDHVALLERQRHRRRRRRVLGFE